MKRKSKMKAPGTGKTTLGPRAAAADGKLAQDVEKGSVKPLTWYGALLIRDDLSGGDRRM